MKTFKKIKKVLLFATSLLILNYSFLTLNHVYAATASFSTSGGGSITTGKTFTVTVTANGSEAFNAVTTNTTFTNLTFVSAAVQGGWTTISGPSNSGGTVSYTGGLLGSSATSKSVVRITFRAPNSPGTSTIKTTGSIALANGSGTQVNGGGNTVTYNVTAAPTPPPATPTPKPAAGAVTISSSSHPDQNVWYKSKDVTFSWNKASGVTDFSYIFDTNPSTNPDDTSEGGDTSKVTTLTEGVSYFHVKAKNDVGWGPATHFKVNFDNSLPDPFCISSQINQAGENTLYFATNDWLSGMSKFTIHVDDNDQGEQKTGYKVNKDAKTVIVTAFDKAGNTREAGINLQTTTGNSTQCPVITPTSKAQGGNAAANIEKEPTNFNVYTIIFMITSIAGLTYSGILSYLYLKKFKAKQQ